MMRTALLALLMSLAALACAAHEPASDSGADDTTDTTDATDESESADASSSGGESSTGEAPIDPGLSVYCEGEGSPAIVFESGLGASANEFAHFVDLIAADTTICRYNRRGILTSPPLEDGVTRTNADWRDDLIAWMDFHGVTEPAIFVAHSAGGITIRALRGSHPERIAGAVMIDTTQAQLLDYDREVFPPEELAALEDFAAGNNTEQWDWATTAAELAALDEDFGDLPMTVLAAGVFAEVDFLSPEQNVERYAVWLQAQMDLAALSTAAVYMVVEGAGHSIHLTDPDVVAAEIDRVFSAVAP